MNFGKRHNAFSDIPGFDASRGERIVKALQRLWAKIEHLEQIRISEKKSLSKEVQTSSNDEDLTISDVQYKLLVLQLQYARSIVRKKLNKSSISFHDKMVENDRYLYDQDERNKNSIKLQKSQDSESKAVSQETQTGNSLIEGILGFDLLQSEDQIDTQVNPHGQVLKHGMLKRNDNATQMSHKTLPQGFVMKSKPHYHLKLDDVPFILGASSTASHSVVANIQNVIASMKCHNKALCGPKHRVQHSAHSSDIHPSRRDSQDAAKMIDELNQDLKEIKAKQEQLREWLDSADGKNQSAHVAKNFQGENKCTVYKANETGLIARSRPKRVRSNSVSSTKLQAEVKYIAKVKEKDFKYNAQQRQYQCNTRSHSDNLPIVARRKLLRSLQNFKTRLSEEDISWE